MTTPFVGRAKELDSLTTDLAHLLSGQGSLSLLVGEPGIGKTRLAEHAAASATDLGAAVHWGRCWQGGGAPAFWPWVQVLRSCVNTPLPALVADGVAWTRELIDLLLGRTATGGAADTAFASEQTRFRLFDAIVMFLQAHARVRPMVLVLDDLHDADEASLLLLEFVSRNLPRSPILVIGTCREAEVRRSSMRTSAFASLARESRRITLRGLEQREVEEFIDKVSDGAIDAGLKGEVSRLTEGNPFFVDEVLRLLLANPRGVIPLRIDIPFTVTEAIRRRLRPVEEPTMELLEAAAALGRDFDLRLLARVVSRSHEDCRVLLEVASREGLVEAVDLEGRAWRFLHVLIREALRDGGARESAQETHLRIATLLAEDRSSGHAVQLSSLSHHLVQALPLAGSALVLDALLQSGRESMAMLAYGEAARDFARAADLLESEHDERGLVAEGETWLAGEGGGDHGDALRMSAAEAARYGEVLFELGCARRCGGHLGDARDTFRRGTVILRPHLTEGGDLFAALFAHCVLGFGKVSETGRVDQELSDLLEEAIGAVGVGDSPLHASLLARFAMALYFSPDSARCLAIGRRAVEMAERCGEPKAHIHALVAEHFVLWRPGTVAERLRVADALFDLCAKHREREAGLEARLWRLTDLLELGQASRADLERRHFDAEAELARLPVHRWQAAMIRCTWAWLEGRYADAEREADHALAIGVAAELPNAKPFHLAQMFQLRSGEGRLGELDPMLRAAANSLPAMPAWAICAAAASFESGSPEEGRRCYQQLAARGFEPLPRDGMWMVCVALLSRIAARLGDRDGAARLHHLLLPHAASWVVSVTAIAVPGPVRLFLGILSATMGDREVARVHLEAARQQCERAGFAALVAQCDTELGKVAAIERARPTKVDDGAGLREAVFQRGSDFWTLAAGGSALRLRDSKGMRYLHYLIQNPERDFHVFDLVTAVEGSLPAMSAPGELALGGAQGDTGPVLDASALAAYKSRFRDVREELAEAEANNDEGRAENLRSESEFLARELAAAVGLGGRVRRGGSPSEQVRVRVTKVIGLAMKRIREADPALGRVLAREIHTGTFCAYRPDPDHPLRWITHAE